MPIRTGLKKEIIFPLELRTALKTGRLAEASRNGQNIRQVVYSQSRKPSDQYRHDQNYIH